MLPQQQCVLLQQLCVMPQQQRVILQQQRVQVCNKRASEKQVVGRSNWLQCDRCEALIFSLEVHFKPCNSHDLHEFTSRTDNSVVKFTIIHGTEWKPFVLFCKFSHLCRAGKRTVKRPKFISPSSQLVICFSLVGVQVLIGAIWIVMSPPRAGPYYPTRRDNQLVCISAVGTEYMIGFAYPILLIVICTVYAILTRKIPEAFNESKYIGFTMYTTCIIWLAFVPIYFSTANNIEIRLATMCFSISLSGTVSLVCLFTPKLYIILLHPERNVRQSMMSSKLHSASTNKTPNSSSCRVDSGTQSDGETSFYTPLLQNVSFNSSVKNFSLEKLSSLAQHVRHLTFLANMQRSQGKMDANSSSLQGRTAPTLKIQPVLQKQRAKLVFKGSLRPGPWASQMHPRLHTSPACVAHFFA